MTGYRIARLAQEWLIGKHLAYFVYFNLVSCDVFAAFRFDDEDERSHSPYSVFFIE